MASGQNTIKMFGDWRLNEPYADQPLDLGCPIFSDKPICVVCLFVCLFVCVCVHLFVGVFACFFWTFE